MRLYRGLSRKYRPGEIAEPLQGTNFTDCPYAALGYANGSGGVLLVVDVPEDYSFHVHEALWSLKEDPEAPRRFMLPASFDQWITAILPAKELRKQLRKPGYSKLSNKSRGAILRMIIEKMLDDALAVKEHEVLLQGLEQLDAGAGRSLSEALREIRVRVIGR